jgi:hypothetical protein
MMRIEIDHHEDDVRVVLGVLAVTDQLVIAHGMKTKVLVALQRQVLASDVVDPCDKLFQAVRPIEIPRFDFVFFRIEILLTPWLAGAVLAELKGGAIDTIARPQCRG